MISQLGWSSQASRPVPEVAFNFSPSRFHPRLLTDNLKLNGLISSEFSKLMKLSSDCFNKQFRPAGLLGRDT